MLLLPSPEKRYRICREENDISQLPEDSRDIFKKNMIDRYINRPNLSLCGGIVKIQQNKKNPGPNIVLDSFYFVEF